MPEAEVRLTPLEALEEIDRRIRTDGECGACAYELLERASNRLKDHHARCPLMVLHGAVLELESFKRLNELAGDSVAFKVRRLELGTGITDSHEGLHHRGQLQRTQGVLDAHDDRLEALENATEHLPPHVEGIRNYTRLEVVEERLDTVEARIVAAEASGDGRLQSAEEKIVALESYQDTRLTPMLNARGARVDKLTTRVEKLEAIDVHVLHDYLAGRVAALERLAAGRESAERLGGLDDETPPPLERIEEHAGAITQLEELHGHHRRMIVRVEEHIDRVESSVLELEQLTTGHVSDRIHALESDVVALQALERVGPEEPEVEGPIEFRFDTWAARRIAVSQRAVAHLEALDPSHVMSPLFESLVKQATDVDRPTQRLEELQQAAEDLMFIWTQLETTKTGAHPITELAHALRTWLQDELER